MINLLRLFPAGTALIAFVITLCCLFAGTQKNLLDSVNLLRLYTPEGASSSTVQDFYSIHVMSYCQGTLKMVEPGTTADITRNVTHCSNRTILFSFDPTEAWPTEITNGSTLEWPRVISDDFHAFRTTSRSMAVLYCIGVGAMGAVLVVRAASFAAPRIQQGPFEFGFLVLGSLSVIIASIIATVIALEFVALLNAHGDGSGVSAKYGDKFIGMTWAAAGLLLVGSITSFYHIFIQGAPVEVAAPTLKDEEEG